MLEELVHRINVFRSHEKDVRKVKAVVFDPVVSNWNDVRVDVLRVQNEAFEPPRNSEKSLAVNFENPANTVVLLGFPKQKFIGYAIAVPSHVFGKNGRTIDITTAYVAQTAIQPEFQKIGLLPPLLTTLDDSLIAKGYTYVSRSADVTRIL